MFCPNVLAMFDCVVAYSYYYWWSTTQVRTIPKKHETSFGSVLPHDNIIVATMNIFCQQAMGNFIVLCSAKPKRMPPKPPDATIPPFG